MNEIEELVSGLHPLERKVLPKLENKSSYKQLTKDLGMQEVEVMRALQWLENKGAVALEHDITITFELDKKGEDALKNGLPERSLLKALPAKIQELAQKAQIDQSAAGAALGVLKRNKFVDVENGTVVLSAAGKKALQEESIEEKFLKKLEKGLESTTLQKQEEAVCEEFKKRGLIKITEKRDRIITITALGKKLLKADLSEEYADKVTPEDLKSGAWKTKKYRSYDVTINVPLKVPGKTHFVNDAIESIKNIWVELGFQEMEGSMISTAFWDMDALFVPQDHPAREMQDTFYLGKKEKIADQKTYERVKAAHENGADTGSLGWRYSFDKNDAEQLMLRTHTTVLSAHTLHAIGQKQKSLPGKFFAVGSVFRNEDLDWKHLFEFHQVEGIVVDRNANFSHLLGYLELFFKKLGYEKVRVRPAHFPYTEPSVEVDGWHPRKKQWVELGGAGLFRPEVTKTLMGEEIPVLAWGIGMERSISEYFDITDLRDLYGNDIKQLRTIKKWVK